LRAVQGKEETGCSGPVDNSVSSLALDTPRPAGVLSYRCGCWRRWRSAPRSCCWGGRA